MNPHLEHAASDGCGITEVAGFRRTNPGKNARFANRVAETLEPLVELGRSQEGGHGGMYPSGYVPSSSWPVPCRPNGLQISGEGPPQGFA